MSKLLAATPYTIEDGITQSLLGAWVHCRTNARMTLDGWRRPENTEALDYGSMFHQALEMLYCGIRGGTITAPEHALGIPGTVARKWGARTIVGAEVTQSVQVCLAQLAAVWPAYLNYYKRDFRKALWLDVEGLFDVRWRGFRLRGRRDGMLRVNKKLWLFETKTKGQIREGEIEDALGFDFQSLYYLTANEAELAASKSRTRRIQGVRYNVVRRPGHKVGKKSLPEYSAHIAADIAKEPSRWFMRYEAAYTPKQVQEFQVQLEDKLHEFAKWLHGERPTYRDELSCRGRYNCSYLAACGQGSMVGYEQDGTLFEELED